MSVMRFLRRAFTLPSYSDDEINIARSRANERAQHAADCVETLLPTPVLEQTRFRQSRQKAIEEATSCR